MNYKPLAGFWFYGGANATQTANFMASWGLMADLPAPTAPPPVTTYGRFAWNWICVRWNKLISKWDYYLSS